MGLSELATMAFIEDEDHALVLEFLHHLQVPLFADSRVELLKGGHDEGSIVRELVHQLFSVVGRINASFLEAVELFDGLEIEVFAVHDKGLSKLAELRDFLVLFVGPEKGLLEVAPVHRIVRVVLGVE